MSDAPAPGPLENMLDSALGNPVFVKKLMRGDAGARSLFDNLTRHSLGMEAEPASPNAAAVLTDPSAGVDLFAPDAVERLPDVSSIGGPHAMSDRQKVDMVATMRQHGMSETIIREAFDDGRTYTAEVKEAAQQKWQDLSGDQDFRQRLFSGDPVAARQWRAHAIIMAGGTR
jgi:hypothetical protein